MTARNYRLRQLFIVDAKKMVLSLISGCADECNIVLPYFLDSDDLDVILSARCVKSHRAEFAIVVEERRRRAAAAAVARSSC